MRQVSRRAFLENLGTGMLLVGGGTLATGMSMPFSGRDEIGKPLDFGSLEKLAALMQDTEADRLQVLLIKKLQAGTPRETLLAAAALANARTFGGEDYVGYHVLMALIPALDMAPFLSESLQALPLLKVLHRNARRIQECGGRRREKMRPVVAVAAVSNATVADRLVELERAGDLENSLKLYSAAVRRDPLDAFEALQPVVRENIDVHQVVLAWRSWDLIRLVGQEHTETLLLQALRQCISREQSRQRRGRAAPEIRGLLPRTLASHGLKEVTVFGTRVLDDHQLDSLAAVAFRGSREQATEAAAAALADGVSPESVGEALSLASLQLLLHDPGRARGDGDKPKGSVHGASLGIHASDSASAWRHIAAVCRPETAAATILTAAWHTGGRGQHASLDEPYHATGRSNAAKVPTDRLLEEIESSVAEGDQVRATALTERYGATVGEEQPLLRALAQHLINQDGALHHEKFFDTAVEEFGRTRKAYRWQWLTGLARVAASGQGFSAPGVAEARRMLDAS